MTTRALLLVLAIFALPSATSAQALTSHCAILPASQGHALLHQCSRSTPTHMSGFWTPSVSQVIAIERGLPELLRKSGHTITLSDSRRQYIGVISRGKRLIYLNAFPASALDASDRTNWKTTAFTVCDGGDAFWGTEFDPATNSFRDLQFNGEA